MASDDEGGIRLTGDLFDRYLDRAETILASADRHRARLHLYRALLIGIGALTAVLVAALVVATQNPLAGGARLVFVLAAAVAASFAVNKWLMEPTRRLYTRDEDAMVGIITVLRDVAPHLDKSEHWDPDRRQVVNRRLERFPVGSRNV